MSETADKNTFAGALAQESSHYVTLSNCTIAAISCQQVFSMFLKFFDTLVICLAPHADGSLTLTFLFIFKKSLV